MALQAVELCARLRVPDADGGILAAAGRQLTIWAKSHSIDSHGMSIKLDDEIPMEKHQTGCQHDVLESHVLSGSLNIISREGG